MAPDNSNKSYDPHHWCRLEELKPGDIIFHIVDGYIEAVSIVKSRYYHDEVDVIHYMWKECPNVIGRKVDCEYCFINNPILTAKYKNEIIDSCKRFCHQPFNKNGTGNQGYLFELNKPLAVFFLERIIEQNKNEDIFKEILDKIL